MHYLQLIFIFHFHSLERKGGNTILWIFPFPPFRMTILNKKIIIKSSIATKLN